MIWFTWRQFRTPAWIALGGLAVIAAILAVTGHDLADLWASSGAAACHTDCDNAVGNFLDAVKGSVNDKIFNLSLALMYVVPPVIGIFWGAPLLARELEAGTYRLAFNQSVTRTRWLATKLAIIGGAAVVTTGLLSWAVTGWAHHIDNANNNRIGPLLFGARGIVPIGYALFAFVLGVTAGMFLRRTVTAMAATLAVYIGAVVSMPLWIRPHLAPVSHVAMALDVSSPMELMMGPDQLTVRARGSFPGAWVLSNNTVTPDGKVFTGPPDLQYCGPDHGPKQCLDWVGTLGLRTDLAYQPASHFWQLQFAETGIFVGIAVLLAGVCFWWTRRRLI